MPVLFASPRKDNKTHTHIRTWQKSYSLCFLHSRQASIHKRQLNKLWCSNNKKEIRGARNSLPGWSSSRVSCAVLQVPPSSSLPHSHDQTPCGTLMRTRSTTCRNLQAVFNGATQWKKKSTEAEPTQYWNNGDCILPYLDIFGTDLTVTKEKNKPMKSVSTMEKTKMVVISKKGKIHFNYSQIMVS